MFHSACDLQHTPPQSFPVKNVKLVAMFMVHVPFSVDAWMGRGGILLYTFNLGWDGTNATENHNHVHPEGSRLIFNDNNFFFLPWGAELFNEH